jgi:hypothetical protein
LWLSEGQLDRDLPPSLITKVLQNLRAECNSNLKKKLVESDFREFFLNISTNTEHKGFQLMRTGLSCTQNLRIWRYGTFSFALLPCTFSGAIHNMAAAHCVRWTWFALALPPL